jgi:hypothetical protein
MMNRRRLGSKDIHLDANSLRPLWLADAGGGNFPEFIPAIAGYDSTLASAIFIDVGLGVTLGINLPGGNEADGGGWFKTPAGYTGTLTVTPLITFWNSAGGNIRVVMQYKVRPIDGDDGTYTSGTETTVTLPSGTGTHPSAGDAMSLSSIAASVSISAESIVMLNMYRDGDDVLDTYADQIDIWGFKVEYG